jgi:superfamily II DNA helicase RecQ
MTTAGHDFRPDYAKLGTLKKVFPHTPMLTLTATANSTVRSDVLRILCIDSSSVAGGETGMQLAGGMVDVDIDDDDDGGRDDGGSDGINSLSRVPPAMLPPKIFLGDFDRPNLYFAVWPKPSDFSQAVLLLARALPAPGEGSAIVYCLSQSELLLVLVPCFSVPRID